MAKERGFWNLNTTTEPNDLDKEHIADQIKEGFTSGEICEDETEKDEDKCSICGTDEGQCEHTEICPVCGSIGEGNCPHI